VNYLRQAERLADLGVDDCADLHWEADLDVAGPSRRSLDAVRLLNLQIARLAWAHHAIVRARGPHSHYVADTISTAIGAIIQLIEAWLDRPDTAGILDDAALGRHGEHGDPILTDSLLMFGNAANQLARVLLTRPCVGPAPIQTHIGTAGVS
jgi:hypothetical protein